MKTIRYKKNLIKGMSVVITLFEFYEIRENFTSDLRLSYNGTAAVPRDNNICPF